MYVETLAFCTASVVALVMTPILARVARHVGLVDVPDGKLKRHGRQVPYLGGVALLLGFTSALLMGATIRGIGSQSLAALLGGAILVVFFGILDDWLRFSVRVKLLLQTIAALTTALTVQRLPFQDDVSLPITLVAHVIWLVAMMNAVNMLDVMDGLAASVVFCASMGYLVFSWVEQGPFCGLPVAAAGASLVGAVFGFVPFNLPPARIFLGEAGSALLGFLLATLAMVDVSERRHMDEMHAYLVYVFFLAVPLFELVFVSCVRLVSGKSVFKGSNDHSVLRLRRKGLGERAALLVFIFISLACAAGGIGISFLPFRISAFVLCGAAAIAVGVGVLLTRYA